MSCHDRASVFRKPKRQKPRHVEYRSMVEYATT